MKTTKLQIPIQLELMEKSKAKADQLGFSSLNEMIRVILTQFTTQDITIDFKNREKEYKALLDEEIKKSLTDILKNKKKGYTNAEDLVKSLTKD